METLSSTRKIIYSATAVVLFGLLIEGAARLWLNWFPPKIETATAMGIGDTHWFEILQEDLAPQGDAPDLYIPDPERFWKLNPDRSIEAENVVYRMRGEPLRWHLKTNADGHRGTPYPAAPAAPVIVALGDSSTFGFRVNDDDTYPAQLQRNLRAHGLPEAAVVNYGIPGYSSFQGRKLLAEILTQHDPDFVLLSFGTADHKTDILSDAQKADRAFAAKQQLSEYFELPGVVRIFHKPPSFKRRRPTDLLEPPNRVSEDEFRSNMQAMINLAQRSGARVILLDLSFVEPVLGGVTTTLARANRVPRIDGRTLLRDELLELLEGRQYQEERVARQQFWKDKIERYRPIYYSPAFFKGLFDDPVWNGLLLFFLVDPIHPNALGNQIIAEALAALIDQDRNETVTEPESAAIP